MTEAENKKSFVENELAALLKKIDPDIERAEYEPCKWKIARGGSNISYITNEYVHVLYGTTGGQITINVTADSLGAITRDVLKQIL